MWTVHKRGTQCKCKPPTMYYLACFRCCRSRRRQRPTAAATVDTRDARGRRRSAPASTRSYPARSRPETRNSGSELKIRSDSPCDSSSAIASAAIWPLSLFSVNDHTETLYASVGNSLNVDAQCEQVNAAINESWFCDYLLRVATFSDFKIWQCSSFCIFI